MDSNKKKKLPTISPKQVQLAEAYLATGSYAQAAATAGYSNARCAWHVLAKPQCREWLALRKEIGDIQEQDVALDLEAQRGTPSKMWVLRRLVKRSLSNATKATDEVRALALISEIIGLTRQPVQTVLQPIVVKDESGKDLYEFSQKETETAVSY
jgi:hypothetical protein